MGVLDAKMRSTRQQLDNIINFLTQPVGVFETIDRMIKTFRESNREALQTIGVSIPGVGLIKGNLGFIKGKLRLLR